MEGFIEMDEVKTVADLDRLNPHVYSMLCAAPVNTLDLFRLKLEFQETIRDLAANFERELQHLSGKNN